MAAAVGAGAATQAPLAGVGGSRRRVLLTGVSSRSTGERTPRERPQQVRERRDSSRSTTGKSDTCTNKPENNTKGNGGSCYEEDEGDCAQTAAKDLQAKRLYAALTYSSDHEREAYRRNKTEQTRLEMALEHIGMQRSVASKTMQREVNVMKVRSTRIDDRARLTADGARSRTPRVSRASSTHPLKPHPAPSVSRGPFRSVSTFQGHYSNHRDADADDDDTLELPEIGATLRRSGRHGARSITFISETVYQNRPSANPLNGPQQSVLGPSAGVRSNVAGYLDTSTLRKPVKVVPATATNPRLNAVRQQTVHQVTNTQTTKSAYQPLSRLRSSLKLQQQQQNQQKPLMAIFTNVMPSSNRIRSSKPTLDASKSLDADIDAVLNARFDGGGDEGDKRMTIVTRSQGFGLRQPANFSSNYKPPEDTPRESPDEAIAEDAIAEEDPDEDDGVRETLRSFTSLSHRPGIDRIATPSSNALRGEGRGGGHPKAFSARSAQASIGMNIDLSNQRRRGHVPMPPLRPGFSLHGAILREKTHMKKFEDKLDSFYEKLKGTSAKTGNTARQNPWDLRGLDEKLLIY